MYEGKIKQRTCLFPEKLSERFSSSKLLRNLTCIFFNVLEWEKDDKPIHGILSPAVNRILRQLSLNTISSTSIPDSLT